MRPDLDANSFPSKSLLTEVQKVVTFQRHSMGTSTAFEKKLMGKYFEKDGSKEALVNIYPNNRIAHAIEYNDNNKNGRLVV